MPVGDKPNPNKLAQLYVTFIQHFYLRKSVAVTVFKTGKAAFCKKEFKNHISAKPFFAIRQIENVPTDLRLTK